VFSCLGTVLIYFKKNIELNQNSFLIRIIDFIFLNLLIVMNDMLWRNLLIHHCFGSFLAVCYKFCSS